MFHLLSLTTRLPKKLSESFDGAQDERREFDMMISVHAEVLETFLIVFQQPASA
jgi:hypothetical protein